MRSFHKICGFKLLRWGTLLKPSLIIPALAINGKTYSVWLRKADGNHETLMMGLAYSFDGDTASTKIYQGPGAGFLPHQSCLVQNLSLSGNSSLTPCPNPKMSRSSSRVGGTKGGTGLPICSMFRICSYKTGIFTG